MELSYRGIHYHQDPHPSDATPEVVDGKYRGHQYGWHYTKHVEMPQADYHLRYRGIQLNQAADSASA